ncbi:hypothetical protein [Pseudomonas sp. T1.Ur]|uniref:hypothetical protein n=1 Tax=Pseudomonas sp. T1.Ur TaxID=2928704 RepID=UPI00201DE307|nr:hypothetical protein [Pseudomonas sp. T1.Ur]MCL6702629.1 hypothetical protein [Pseudomonas sp. T1.Ur]
MMSHDEKIMLAKAKGVWAGDLDEHGTIRPYMAPVFDTYKEADVASVNESMDGGPGPAVEFDENEVYTGWCPNGSLQNGVCKPFNNNRTHWMSTYSGVRRLPIHLAILPGTHNSGFDKQAASAPSMETCQDVPPHDQLNAGIRVLDIRVHHYHGYPPGDARRFMIFHSTTNGRTIAGDIIGGVKNFHSGPGWDRRREVVVLDFHEFRNFTAGIHAEFCELLITMLGTSIISPTYKNMTINQLWALSGYKNVVIAYNNGARHPLFWPGVTQRWIGSNTPSESELKAFIDRVGNETKPAGELRSIQAARYVLPFYVPKDMSGQLMSWFASGSVNHPIMKYYIINCDWSLRHRLVDNIIYSNSLRATSLGIPDLVKCFPGEANRAVMPGAKHMIIEVRDNQWSPMIALPEILDDEPHRLLIISKSSRECVLDMRSSDCPLDEVELCEGDVVALVSVPGTRSWGLQARHFAGELADGVVPAPGEGEKFIRITLANEQCPKVLSLPATAAHGSVILVTNEALEKVRLSDAYARTNSSILQGETHAFIYNSDIGDWQSEALPLVH